MFTKEKRAAANKIVTTIPIKGKDYATVASRLNAFWEVCPDGGIDTYPYDVTETYAVFHTKIYDENGKTIATGTGMEFKSDNPKDVNYTSYVENAETSSVGRALANAGIGSQENIASAEELAIALMEKNDMLTGKRLLSVFCTEHALTAADVAQEHGLDKVSKGLSWPYYKVVAELMEKNNE